ncbi:MAG: hypothetical protein AAF787_23165 [Chloroflexota bacterium]
MPHETFEPQETPDPPKPPDPFKSFMPFGLIVSAMLACYMIYTVFTLIGESFQSP